jgi:hypothetical protein
MKQPQRYPAAIQCAADRVDTSVMSRSRKRAAPVHRTTGRIVQLAHRISGAIAVVAFSPLEEDFFRAGDALSEVHDFSDLDEGYRPTSIWGALVGWLRGDRGDAQ